LKVNLISKRAQNFLNHPEYYCENSNNEFTITFDKSGKILTVFHHKNSFEVATVFADVLSRFAKNKYISELWKINFREVDSFLRDENHLPAFPEDQNLAEEILLKTKIILIADATKTLLENKLLLLGQQISQWEELNLANKNKWAQTLISPLGWELLLCESDVMTVTNTPAEVTALDLTAVLQGVFKSEGKVLPVKLVAV
jgi:NifU-like protein involved in Fe-S cluster formation